MLFLGNSVVRERYEEAKGLFELFPADWALIEPTYSAFIAELV